MGQDRLKHLEEVGVETKSCGSFQGVGVQVTGFVTTPGGSWDGNQVLWKLQEIIVQVAGLVTVPGGSWGRDHVLLKLSGVGVQVAGLVATPGVSWGGDKVSEFRWQNMLQHQEATKFYESCKTLWCRFQDLLQYLEEVGVATMSC